MSTLLVVVLVAAGEASHPATLGAASSARQLLGTDLEIDVRELPTVPNDESAQAMGTYLHAAAIVELVWDTAEHRQAKIRFHLDRRPGWSERVIVFNDADDLRERGRTVGYAIASMMTSSEPGPVPPPPPRPTAEAPPAQIRPLPPAATTTAKARTHGAIDALAALATGIGGPAGGWGGSLSGRWYFHPPLAARLAVSVRSGQVTPAQSTSLFMHLAAGLAWVPIPATRARSFELAARADALLMREQLTHYDSDDAATGAITAMRWLPGADAAIEAAWLFSPNAGFLGSFATEVAFGQTDVTTQGELVTSIPPLRLVLQAGVRATF
jgi:hypothetical protein